MAQPLSEFDGHLAGLRRVPKQARSRALVAKVLAAADELLATEGVEALTTTRVAAAAGVSVGSLYQYLPDRGAIIEAVGSHYLHGIEVKMAALLVAARTDKWADPMGFLIDEFADMFRTDAGFRALWFGRHQSEELRALDREHNTRMAEGVRQIMLALELLPDDERLPHFCAAAQLIGDALLQQAFRNNPQGDENLLREAKSALRGYLAVVRG